MESNTKRKPARLYAHEIKRRNRAAAEKEILRAQKTRLQGIRRDLTGVRSVSTELNINID
jgi:hypothetical protein